MERPARDSYDLVVVGAGIAGLNALHAATVHLPPDAHVLLVDEKDRPGGMWTMAYDYVRLHQPHPLFTVGGMRWDWAKPANYLARRDEVQAHLAACLEAMRGACTLDTCFGQHARDVREVRQDNGWTAEVDLHPIGAPENGVTVSAGRVIHAAGFNYSAPGPIPLTSDNVVSTTPADLHAVLAQNPDAPAYVVGGGKTGMDTVLAILDENPERRVVLINGGGTYYLNRDRAFPRGLRRWFSGKITADMARDCAMIFDGHNEEVLRQHYIDTYATVCDARSRNHVWGILSDAESTRIEAGLSDKVWDYLDDVIDGSDGPQMRLCGGAVMPVAPGSIFVSCTGSVFHSSTIENRPACLSPNDVILSITPREAMHLLTTYSSFILSHLFFTGKLRAAGLYFIDLQTLYTAHKSAFAATTMAQSYHNLLVGFGNLPPGVLKHFGIDFNRWHPLPRRLLALNRIRKTAQQDVAHCRDALDAVVARFCIDGGVMDVANARQVSHKAPVADQRQEDVT
ncbi:MAG: FAD-dependent oxidoreductase [Pseudomonadota bacterium]